MRLRKINTKIKMGSQTKEKSRNRKLLWLSNTSKVKIVITPKFMDAKNWLKFEYRVPSVKATLDFDLKKNILPIKFPRRFGVTKPDEIPERRDFISFPLLTLSTLSAMTFHLISSKNQLRGSKRMTKNKYIQWK